MRVFESLSFTAITQINQLLKAYLLEKKDIKQLYQFFPNIAAIPAAIEAKKRQNIDREGLHAEIKRQYADSETIAAITAANIAALQSEDTFCITAAHQPALFTGPLYTFYKIANVINIAQKCKALYPQYNFVPVFWMGSEDHDFEELNHTFIGEKKIQFNESFSGPIGQFHTTDWQRIIAETMTATANPTLLAAMQHILNKDIAFVKITKAFLQLLFDQYGLVIVNQDNFFFKQQFSAIITDEVLNQRATNVLADNTVFLQENYHVPITLRTINFFKIDAVSRQRIVMENAVFSVLNTTAKYSAQEIAADIAANPQQYSPNVVFRPLLQEKVLPNICFVGGGGEVSYWLQLKPLFDYYQIAYPIVTLRNSYFISNNFIEKKREKYGFTYLDFFTDKNTLLKQWLIENEGENLDFSSEENAIEKIYAQIIAKLKLTDASLEGNAKAELQKALNGIQQIRQKVLKSAKRNNEEMENALQKIYAQLFPDGVWQERHQNLLRFSAEELKMITDFLIFAEDGFSQKIKVIGF